MCNHSYDRPRPASFYEEQICPIESLFHLLGKTELAVPLDNTGCCLFHSKDKKFRRNYNLGSYLIKLMDALQIYSDSAKPNTKILLSEIKLDATGEAEVILEGYDLSNLEVYFNDSNFGVSVTVITTTFGMVSFAGCIFEAALEVNDSYVTQGNFHRTTFRGLVNFESCVFKDFTDFSYAKFYSGCSFSDFHFHASVLFSYASFLRNEYSPIAKWQGIFSGFVDFSNAVFDVFAMLSYCQFDAEVNCTDTIFKSRLFIQKAIIKANFILKGSPQKEPVFQDLVDIDLNPEDVTGKLILENINFLKINHEHKKVIFDLEKDNKADIGKGCIKYRLRTPLKKIQLNQDKQSIIIEFSNAFVSYFIQSSGKQLGLEVVDRSENYLTYFLFSDEAISEEEFFALLAYEERNYFNLIMPFKLPFDNGIVKNSKRILMKVDGMASLFSSFVKVGIRISTGDWTRRDTHFLMNAINNRSYEENQVKQQHEFFETYFNERRIAQKIFIEKYVAAEINNPLVVDSSIQISENNTNFFGPKDESE